MDIEIDCENVSIKPLRHGAGVHVELSDIDENDIGAFVNDSDADTVLAWFDDNPKLLDAIGRDVALEHFGIADPADE